MKRSVFVALASVASAIPRISLAQAPTIVRIGTYPVEAYALVIIANQHGSFERNGIEARVSYIASASAGITAAIVGGALDVGCSSMGATSNAHLRGVPLKMFAPGAIISSAAPTTEMVVLKSSPYHSAKDLNGKTLGASTLREVIEVAQLQWMDLNGGDSKTVKVIELPPPAAVAALRSGRIDAYGLMEPFLTATRADMRSFGGLYNSIGPRIMISHHVATEAWLEQNSATARRFVTAMREAAQWANENHSGADAIIAKATKIPPEVFEKMNHVTFGETLEVATIQPQVDALAKYGFIDRRYNVSDIIWSGARS